MKRLLLPLVLVVVMVILLVTPKGKQITNTVVASVVTPSLIDESGTTISSRTLIPEGYTRVQYPEGSFSAYIQQYDLKAYGAKIINYDGSDYFYQRGHYGILEVPVPDNGLQQCADALIRLRAEYLWEQNRKDEIGFQFTSGHYCSWTNYAKGIRPKINGNQVSFHQTAVADNSKQSFYRYLNLIYMYAGTLSLSTELPTVNRLDEVEVGDMLIYPGSPGHIIMVADVALAPDGRKLLIFAQGNTPAQSVHLLKNPNDLGLSPWYEVELGEPLNIPTYSFDEVKFVRFK